MTDSGRLGSLFHRIAYPFYYKRKLGREDHLRLLGFSLTVVPGVFHPGLFFSSKIFGRYLSSVDLKGRSVLEMGSGSGLLSLVAARGGAAVTGVDINPLAVEWTRRNALANGLGDRVTAVESDLFGGIGDAGRFDYIIWNPPFYPREPSDPASRAMQAGTGYAVLKDFAREAGRHLAPDGIILLILTGRASDERKIIGFFEQAGFEARPVHERRSWFETFRIWRIEGRSKGESQVAGGKFTRTA